MMYHLKVELTERRMSDLVAMEDNDFKEVFKESVDQECVEFSVGNPRVEHITGVVHLYKRNNAPIYGSSEPWKTAEIAAAESSTTLCCLAIPADMSVANFCTFIGAYLGEVMHIQVLRREASQPSVCMVLLTFAAQEQADNFYADYNSLPFSSLEPDILCRLIYVRSIEVLSSQGREPAASLSSSTAAAMTSAQGGSGHAVPDAEQQAQQQCNQATAAATGAPLSSKNNQHVLQVPDTSKAADIKAAKQTSQQQQQQTQSSAVVSYAAAVGGSSSNAKPGSGTGSDTQAPSPVEKGAAASMAQSWLDPPAGTTELPTCPVCLERLDEHISGVVTTVCNHRFHGECIKHWGDTSCPVCRYCMLSSSTSTSRCSTCGANNNLWICLICGHVGCGRYKQGHANDHWKASAHCYALELETQRVWDYAGDGYVHRLIQSKTDGKLVEVPSPAPTCPHGSPSVHRHRRHHHNHQRDSREDPLSRSRIGPSAAAAAGACSSGTDADTDVCTEADCPVCANEDKQMKEALVSSKLEAISLEYNHLLATQLDSQRQYFEGLLAHNDAKQQAAVAAAKAAAEQAQAGLEAAAASVKDHDRKRQQLEKKLSDLTSSVSKVQEERDFLHSLNETLLSNQKAFNSKLATAQADIKEKEAQLQDLQEQVRDLMVFIEAQRTIQAAGGSELQEATLLPVPQSQGSSARSSRRSSSKRQS